MNDDEAKLIAAYAADRSLTNRNRIVTHFSYIVDIALRKMFNRPPKEQIDDLHSAGVIGLIQAADRFDPTLGINFQSYAGHRVAGAILDACRVADPLSRQSRSRVNTWDEASSLLGHSLGRYPTQEEIEAHLGLMPNQWKADLHAARRSAKSLPADDIVDTDHMSLLTNARQPSPADMVASNDNFDSMLNDGSLNRYERHALRLRFKDEMIIRNIAKAIDYSENYTLMFLGSALDKLRSRAVA